MTEEPITLYGRIPFDYKRILLIHLRNMSSLLTAKVFLPVQPNIHVDTLIRYSKEITDVNFVSSVDFLAELLSPYIDEEYQKEMELLLKKSNPEMDRDFAIKKLGIVVRLMDRLNLLLEQQKGEKV